MGQFKYFSGQEPQIGDCVIHKERLDNRMSFKCIVREIIDDEIKIYFQFNVENKCNVCRSKDKHLLSREPQYYILLNRA